MSLDYKEIVKYYDTRIWSKSNYLDTKIHELRLRPIFDKIRISPFDKILDLGCGNVRYLDKLKKYDIKYFGTDLSLKILQKNLKTGKGDFIFSTHQYLPFQNISIDVVISIASMYYLNEIELKKTLKEIFRILTKNGKVYLTFMNPLHPYYLECLIKKMIRNRFYGNFYNPQKVVKIMQEIGFDTVKLHYYGFHPQFTIGGIKIIPNYYQNKIVNFSNKINSDNFILKKYSMNYLISACKE